MSFAALALVAFALSIDNFTIALAVGAQTPSRTLMSALRLPIVFGVFAAVAPAVGWFAGSQVAGLLTRYGGVAACAILVYVGWRTLRSAWQSVNAGLDAASLPAALALGLSTSMDSLAVGFAMALAHANVLALATINGGVCAVLSLVGIVAGERIGTSFPSQSRFVAGLVLIAVGLRALLSVH
ncbi:MAG: manganese efflux pump [Candidatus Eremiobacteraeota bacterium]|nr:manganese efflux pump [Candidatus Eremiobacteraeota bacterium]